MVTASEIRDIMALMAQGNTKKTGEISIDGVPANNQYAIISKLFSGGEENQGKLQGQRQCQSQHEHILLRLVVLDSYYATNAAYSYFSLEDLAQRIIDETTAFAKKPKAQKLSDNFFYHILLQNIKDPSKDEGKVFFEASYGIKKDGSQGASLKSLISKYANYCLQMDTTSYPLGFPIYDSLARKSYRKVMIALGLKPQMVTTLDYGSIGAYIVALNELREAIFGKNNTSLFHGMQQFDILDAYLWQMGKLEGGNLSLLLTKSEYEQLIANVKLAPPKKVNNKVINPVEMQILNKLKDKTSTPFAGIGGRREVFLNTLLAHWRNL